MNRIPVGVLGASGYAGRELCAIVARHPAMQLAFATANEQRGQKLRAGASEIELLATEDARFGDADLVFSALPHGASKTWVAAARQAGCRVVDLSSDLRPGSGCEGVPYGLTELARDRIAGAGLVSNPGCYPTSVLLALAPLFARNLVPDGATITINSASGVTGAGNSPKREFLFAEVDGDYRAYGIGNTHRHTAEMKAAAASMGGDVDLVFTPHLLPVARGILSTMVVPLVETPGEDMLAPWREHYADEPFIELSVDPPALRDVVHRNIARIAAFPVAATRTPAMVVISAIDNLVKGAAGQAVQNANLMLGLPEIMGLPS